MLDHHGKDDGECGGYNRWRDSGFLSCRFNQSCWSESLLNLLRRCRLPLSAEPGIHLPCEPVGLQAVKHASDSARMSGECLDKAAGDLCLLALCSGLSG